MKNKSYFERQEAPSAEPTYDEELAARTGAKPFVRSRSFNPHLVADSERFEEFLVNTASRIQKSERRKRRSAAASDAFMAALRALMLDLFSASMVDRELQVGVNLGAYRYAAAQRTRYDNPQLTYRQVKAAFAGLQRLGYLQVDKNGWHDGKSGKGANTKVRATQALIDVLGETSLTECQLNQSPSAEIIILRGTKCNGNAPQIDYDDTAETREMRERLRYINRVNGEHALALSISKSELKSRMRWNDAGNDHEDVDLTARSLCRIFNDGQFDRGGRFYGGWWQNVPEQLRQHITIDDEPTVEADYSAFHARLLYARDGMDCPKDPYDIGIERRHRGWVKRAFNTLLNATGNRIDRPPGYHADVIGLEYGDLLELVRQHHQPIAEHFNTGIGVELQFLESCIAEEIMMRFAGQGLACLPIHDSFVVQWRYLDGLIEAMLISYETIMGNELRTDRLEEAIHIRDIKVGVLMV